MLEGSRNLCGRNPGTDTARHEPPRRLLLPGAPGLKPEIRGLSLEDLDAYLEHHARHRAESGKGGDSIFTPFPDSKEVDGARSSHKHGWNKSLEEPGWIRTWGAFVEGRVVGDVELHGGDIEATRHRAFLGVGVQRPHRGSGLGRALMETAISWAREAGVAGIDLGVFEGNSRALGLYNKLGFEIVGTFEDAFRVSGQSITDIRMVLDLRK